MDGKSIGKTERRICLKQQMIITLGREFGSGGHEIAEKLAAHYDLPMYDRDLLKKVAEQYDLEPETVARFDEKPKNKLFSRTEKGLSNSPEYNIAQMQFQFLRDRAEAGESFLVVGRCAETVLKDYAGRISIFVWGDDDKRVERIMGYFQISRKKAELLMRETDRKRRQYHDSYSEHKWMEADNYDLTINSSAMGVEKTAEILIHYIDARRQQEENA